MKCANENILFATIENRQNFQNFQHCYCRNATNVIMTTTSSKSNALKSKVTQQKLRKRNSQPTFLKKKMNEILLFLNEHIWISGLLMKKAS